MTDLEMIRKCAEKMGYRMDADNGFSRLQQGAGMDAPEWFEFIYDPFRDKTQAMELVEKLRLNIEPCGGTTWEVWRLRTEVARDSDLRRAIVECVSKLP